MVLPSGENDADAATALSVLNRLHSSTDGALDRHIIVHESPASPPPFPTGSYDDSSIKYADSAPSFTSFCDMSPCSIPCTCCKEIELSFDEESVSTEQSWHSSYATDLEDNIDSEHYYEDYTDDDDDDVLNVDEFDSDDDDVDEMLDTTDTETNCGVVIRS